MAVVVRGAPDLSGNPGGDDGRAIGYALSAVLVWGPLLAISLLGALIGLVQRARARIDAPRA